MHVHEDDLDVAGPGQLLVGDPERRIGVGRHEDLALEVQNADGNTRGRGLDREPAPRVAGRVVGRPQEAIGGVQRVVDLLLVPDVIAGGEDVDRHPGQIREELVGQAEAPRRVLDVDDGEVDPFLVDQRKERVLQGAPPRGADDVADEQEVHGES